MHPVSYHCLLIPAGELCAGSAPVSGLHSNEVYDPAQHTGFTRLRSMLPGKPAQAAEIDCSSLKQADIAGQEYGDISYMGFLSKQDVLALILGRNNALGLGFQEDLHMRTVLHAAASREAQTSLS